MRTHRVTFPKLVSKYEFSIEEFVAKFNNSHLSHDNSALSLSMTLEEYVEYAIHLWENNHDLLRIDHLRTAVAAICYRQTSTARIEEYSAYLRKLM